MTFADRAAALATAFDYTPRQARFLTLVSLISGYFLRRHYCAFAQIIDGKNTRTFFDDLRRRALVTVQRPRADRGWLYHLRARALYDLLDLSDNRNRRVASPPRQARRLMLLDFAINHPTAHWYATEAEKITLCTKELTLPSDVMPARHYVGADKTRTVRRFIHKLPIFRLPDSPEVCFVVLGLDTTGQSLTTFLNDHARLLAAIAHWHLVVVYPRLMRAGVAVWRRALAAAHVFTAPTLSHNDARELHAYFRIQHALQVGSATPVIIDDAHDQRRRQFAGRYDALYAFWRQAGGPGRPTDAPPDFARWQPAGRYSLWELPHAYDLFGQFPGIV